MKTATSAYIRAAILLLVAVLAAAPAWARKIPGEKAGVSFESLVYDFGTIKENDSPVAHDFTFTVTGTQPVAILYATPSCGCTASDFPRKPVKSGESGSIHITFNPRHQQGEVNKDVRVRMKNGAGKSEQITLRITGVVIPE